MNQAPQNTDSIGYLQVNVTTAQGAIPLEGASVNLRGATPETSGVIRAMRTGRDGQTEKIALPTPPIGNSASPNAGIPYALYSIDVKKDGYRPLFFENVPVFPSILSIQPAVMVPASPREVGE